MRLKVILKKACAEVHSRSQRLQFSWDQFSSRASDGCNALLGRQRAEIARNKFLQYVFTRTTSRIAARGCSSCTNDGGSSIVWNNHGREIRRRA